MSRTLRLIVVGAAAGLVASWAMEEGQKAIAEAAKAAGSPPPEGDPSTVKAADRLALAFTGNPIVEAKRKSAGRTVHYVTGAGLGVIYTLLADRASFITAGFGGLFGFAVSLGLDEVAVPALGLSAKPSDVPAERHAEGIGAHLVFGGALEAARRVMTLAA